MILRVTSRITRLGLVPALVVAALAALALVVPDGPTHPRAVATPGARTAAQSVGEIGKARAQARTGFIQHERRRDRREFGDARFPLSAFRRQKSLEEKSVGGESGGNECRERRRRAGDGKNSMACRKRGLDQLVARVRDKRRARVRDERDRRAIAELRQHARTDARRVVFMIGEELRPQAVAVEEPPRHPRVLAADEVGAREHRERAQRHVRKVPDRRRRHIKARRELHGLDRMRRRPARPGG